LYACVPSKRAGFSGNALQRKNDANRYPKRIVWELINAMRSRRIGPAEIAFGAEEPG
jgi:hypothetical protein